MSVLPDMIGIAVSDMPTALRFYRFLGIEVPIDEQDAPYVEVTTPNGYRISWNSLSMLREIDPAYAVEPVGHRIALAFKCETPEEVDSLYHSIVDAGFNGHKPPWDAFWGQRYAVLEDPDGNLVELFAALPPHQG